MIRSETIYAEATAPVKSGLSVIRVSGIDAKKSIEKMTNINNVTPRLSCYSKILDSETKEILDFGLVVFFKSPNSFTGEDVVEFYLHGGRSVVKSVLVSLSKIKEFKLAEAGEFSRRSFYHGKMDLTEAEGLADLIEAETLAQHKQAILQMTGSLRNLYDNLRNSLIEILAQIEAYIDFPEEDIPADLINQTFALIESLKQQINFHLNDGKIGEKIREGINVVIIGEPNVGKSSLLNLIAKRDAAIVSSIKGTTRDVIDVEIDLDGYPIILSDTAGIRDTKDEIEQEGVRRAIKKAGSADIIIYMFDATMESFILPDDYNSDNSIIVINKSDLKKIDSNYLQLSILTRENIDELLQSLKVLVERKFNNYSSAVITRERHRVHLQECLNNLDLFSLDKELVLAAEDLRQAANELGAITGSISVDDVLDVLFSKFCIGK